MTLASSGPAAAGLAAGSWKARARPERATTTSVVGKSFMGTVVVERTEIDPAAYGEWRSNATGQTDPNRIATRGGCRGFRSGPRLYSMVALFRFGAQLTPPKPETRRGQFSRTASQSS